ncbi:anti-phage dCTP deaminase [Pseudomonas sp. TB1-B1]|uniref:anti-phage dCTP deaminase n=1 Tax=Pseudomonas sp. TB1-B1 TaxID=2985515 RepID=UPI0022719649|nr:anti-phage dCTP deaminase [Pseudomonas sp. TB1-B1]MCX9153160.1 anti-phage dCTP deaminase [Pseudomonas sp. TB1-B1]
MNYNDEIISKVFLERNKFAIIGLTGRTGSGCTTTATILESKDQKLPELRDVTYNGVDFFQGLNKRRYLVIKNYYENNKKSFFSIKVSDLISAYILTRNINEIFDFVKENSGHQINEDKLNQALLFGSFSTGKIKNRFQKLIEILINHENPINNIDPSDEKNFIRFMTLIRKFTRDFKKELQEINNDLYVSTYQAAGNSIRRTSRVCPTSSAQDNPDSVFHLPETINRVIKIIRRTQANALIVIDAIRNPYEARFFRDRYSAFYLMSINTPPEDRKKYLQNVHKFSAEELATLDEKESGKTQQSHSEFINQNVKACIQASDIHVFNPRNELGNHNILKAQLAWYIALILHPGLVTPTPMERVMQIAHTAKSNSGCISRQVGAVVTESDYSIKAVGWNDVAKGQVPCSLRNLEELDSSFDPVTYSHYERNDSEFRDAAKKQLISLKNLTSTQGRPLSYCFKDIHNALPKNEKKSGNQVHTRSLHAEENAFLQIAKYGGSGIIGGKLFTTASPCELCAKKAYQLGIEEIVFIDPYPGIATDHIINVGENPPRLTQFMGAVGRGYHQLYEAPLAYKDELDLLSKG